MTSRKLMAAIGSIVPLAILTGSLLGSPPVALAIVGLGLIVGWARVPRFWRTVLRALGAGGLAGLVVLGPGLRLAMRVVAMLEPTRTPEFTLGGTAFLVIGIGLMFGAVTTAWPVLIAVGLRLPRWAGVGLIAVAAAVQLFSDSETLSEFTELGAGASMNVPMFGAVVIAFAHLADRWARPEIEHSSSDETTDAMAARVPS